jgi:hypothetical protein
VFFAFVLTALSRRRLRHRVGVLRQRMIDAEYVVEERVENYDPSKEVTKPEIEGVRNRDNEDEEGEWVDDDEAEDAGAEHL